MLRFLISHRGNMRGRLEGRENEPIYIDDAITKGFNVEVDAWVLPEKKNIISLGHDNPQYDVTYDFFIDRVDKLWIHCKNIDSLEEFQSNAELSKCNYFWHEGDTVTLTSKGYIWAHVGRQPIKHSIAVMPEIYNEDISECIGTCSDYIEKYKNEKNSSFAVWSPKKYG